MTIKVGKLFSLLQWTSSSLKLSTTGKVNHCNTSHQHLHQFHTVHPSLALKLLPLILSQLRPIAAASKRTVLTTSHYSGNLLVDRTDDDT